MPLIYHAMLEDYEILKTNPEKSTEILPECVSCRGSCSKSRGNNGKSR
jgi:hypothetical protein